ncbi:MAG: hypothetical protein ACXWCZ_03380, partial [Flavisolibacter sp.]
MKKIACGSVLQFSLSFILFYLLIAQVSFAQDCKTQAANKPSTLVRGTDGIYPTGKMNSLEMAKMKSHLAKAENWVKKMMTNFTGAKLLYHNIYFPDYLNNGTTHETFYKATGIKSFYISRMMFFAYYCYDNSNTIHTEGESGSTVNVVFNNVFSFGPTSDAGVYTINGKPAFKIIQKKRSEGRIDFYEQRAQNNANAKMYTTNDYILLRNSDKPVFIAITRKEYLEQMLKDVEAFKTREMASAKQEFTPANEAANRARFDEELKRIDNSKNYTKEQMAPYRKAFIEKWETEKQKFDRRMAQVEKESNESKDVLLEYLKKPAEWLNRNFRSFYSYSTYTAAGVTQFVEGMDKISMNGVGEIEEDTQQEIVNMNPAYFNKSLSSDVPQLIMVNLRNGNYTHMLKVGVLVKQPGALAPLEAIVNPGKSTSPVVALTEIVSNYVLSYLPKLKTLTPLVVPAGMKSSAIPVTTNYNNPAPAAAVNFTLPPVS